MLRLPMREAAEYCPQPLSGVVIEAAGIAGAWDQDGAGQTGVGIRVPRIDQQDIRSYRLLHFGGRDDMAARDRQRCLTADNRPQRGLRRHAEIRQLIREVGSGRLGWLIFRLRSEAGRC